VLIQCPVLGHTRFLSQTDKVHCTILSCLHDNRQPIQVLYLLMTKWKKTCSWKHKLYLLESGNYFDIRCTTPIFLYKTRSLNFIILYKNKTRFLSHHFKHFLFILQSTSMWLWPSTKLNVLQRLNTWDCFTRKTWFVTINLVKQNPYGSYITLLPNVQKYVWNAISTTDTMNNYT